IGKLRIDLAVEYFSPCRHQRIVSGLGEVVNRGDRGMRSRNPSPNGRGLGGGYRKKTFLLVVPLARPSATLSRWERDFLKIAPTASRSRRRSASRLRQL